MMVLIAPIFALIAVANAASIPGGSEESQIKLPSQDIYAGLFMMGYVMTKVAQPAVTMSRLTNEAFPEMTAGAKDIMHTMDKCLSEATMRNVTVCAKLNAVTYECMTPVREYYEKNLPETARDIPQMIIDSYAAVVQHVCNSKTEDFLELSNICLYKPGTKLQRDELIRTYEEKAKIFKAAPTKANLCGIYDALRPMIEMPIKTSCHSDVTVKAFVALYDASLAPCNM